jgi:hypothetical protein
MKHIKLYEDFLNESVLNEGSIAKKKFPADEAEAGEDAFEWLMGVLDRLEDIEISDSDEEAIREADPEEVASFVGGLLKNHTIDVKRSGRQLEITVAKQKVHEEPLMDRIREYAKSYKIVSGGELEVQGDVRGSQLKLEDLTGIIFSKVTGSFNLSYNKLKSLGGCPREVGGDFEIFSNKITSLQGGPVKVGGNYNCGGNDLTTLIGAPTKVGGMFVCHKNPRLITLEGCPKEIGGMFQCYGNKPFSSLQGAPEKVGGDFYINGDFTEEEIRAVCKVGGKVLINVA